MRSFLCLSILLAFVSSSCTDRIVYIKGEPEGARLLVNGHEMGKTPATIHYDFYGTYEFIVIKDGYESQKLIKKLKAPWYQWPVLDLIFDVLIPFTIIDETTIEYNLVNPAGNDKK